MPFSISNIDSQRFGINVVKTKHISMNDLNHLNTFCIENDAQLSIVRVLSSELSMVQKLEKDGYRLMDTLVYYVFKFNKKAIPELSSDYVLRPVNQNDIEAVSQIAESSFEGYYGHYHADPNLPDDKCDEVYIDWAKKSVTSRDVADEVLVVENENRLDAFATLRMNSEREGEGVLFGVAPHAQGQGMYRSMMIEGMRWCKAQDAERMVVSTQITNIAVQKVWARLGFEMDYSYYTLHKWF